MSTRASHRKQTPGHSLLDSMFSRAELKRTEDGQPIVVGQKPPHTVGGKPLIMIWDELIQLHEGCRQGLEGYTQIVELKDRRDLFEAMSSHDRMTYITTMEQFYRDLKAYDQDLATIRALHAGKTGGETDMDLVMQSIQITEQYENFRTQAERVLGQSYLRIIELVQQAEANLAESAAGTDTNIITDVVSVDVIETEVASS